MKKRTGKNKKKPMTPQQLEKALIQINDGLFNTYQRFGLSIRALEQRMENVVYTVDNLHARIVPIERQEPPKVKALLHYVKMIDGRLSKLEKLEHDDGLKILKEKMGKD